LARFPVLVDKQHTSGGFQARERLEHDTNTKSVAENFINDHKVKKISQLPAKRRSSLQSTLVQHFLRQNPKAHSCPPHDPEIYHSECVVWIPRLG
jgi:hypothetical protein